MSAETGDGDAPSTSPSGSSKKTEPAFTSGKSREKKHGLRLPVMPPLGFNAPTSLVGTPYASSHVPPFEYPFPSSSSVSTPQQVPLYIPNLESPSHSPFPFAPKLIPRGHPHPFKNGKVNSLGLGFPIWNGGSSQSRSKFASSKIEPPVPPGLKEKVKEMAHGAARVSGNGFRPAEGERKQDQKDDGRTTLDLGDEPDMAFDQERPDGQNPSRPQSPDVE